MGGDIWSESSRIILTEKTMLSRMAFDDTYWADCMPDPQGTLVKDLVCAYNAGHGVVGINDTAYVTPDAYRVAMQSDNDYVGAVASPYGATGRGTTHNEHGIYQLKIFNFGDLYGNKKGDTSNGTAFNPASAPVNGSADYETSNAIENKALGDAEFWPNGDGNTNFIFKWILSEEEVEALTHDKAEPVYVTRWFRFIAKDVKRGRGVYQYDKWPYVWVRLTMKIARNAKAYGYEEKIENYWFHYQTGNDDGWSGVFVDIQAPEYEYHPTIADQRWIKNLSDNLVTNKIKFADNDKSRWKYYFAPKEYQITALNGETYTVTPRSGSGDNKWNKLFCKYVYPHDYANFGNANWDSYLPDPATLGTTDDSHVWDEATLEETLAKCAIIYSNEVDATGNTVRDAGVFNDTILYAVRTADYATQDKYTPIAKINYQEQIDGNTGTYATAGQVELVHWLKNFVNKDYAGRTYPIKGEPSINATDAENLVCYDVLNAIGYAMLPNDNEKLDTICAYDNNHNHIGSNDWNKENAKLGADNLPKNGYVNAGSENEKIELYSWLGVVRNNGCNVAQFVKQVKNDGPIATFKASWQRPINLKAPYLDPAIDAKTDENIIYLIKKLELFDWRGIKDIQNFPADAWGYMWKDHYWFWGYYNVYQIDVDLRYSRVMTNLHKGQRSAANEWVPLSDVTDTYDPNHLILRLVQEDGSLIANTIHSYNTWSDWTKTGYNDWTYGHAFQYQSEESCNTYIMNMMGLKAETPNGSVLSEQQLKKNMRRFGAIYYKNDSGNVEEFDLRIPMTIWYEWGYLDYVLNLHVDRTGGN
jgi:hypothetical protein